MTDVALAGVASIPMRNDPCVNLRRIRGAAEATSVTLATLAEPCPWWTWRLSAHFRMASTGSVWALVFLAPLLGPLLAPLALVRFAASSAQMYLNTTLGRHDPLGRRDRIDWMLLAVALAGSTAAAAIDEAYHTGYAWWVLLPVLVPFTAIHLRTALRCYRHATNVPGPVAALAGAERAPIPLPVPQRKAA